MLKYKRPHLNSEAFFKKGLDLFKASLILSYLNKQTNQRTMTMSTKEMHRESCRISYYAMMNARTREEASKNSNEYMKDKKSFKESYQEDWR